jgi:hypothetical protein
VIQVRRLFSILVLVLGLSISTGHATMVLSVNLDQMSQIADRIVLVRVLSSDNGSDENGRWSNFVTFFVEEAFKGDVTVGSILKIKQVSQKPREGQDGSVVMGTLFRGLPQYKEGEEALLFLNGDSAIGFTSPVGLGQGAFRVMKDEFGGQMLVNDVGNVGLFKNMTFTSTLKTQGISETTFKTLISDPKNLYLDQMRVFLKMLIDTNESNKKE